VSSVHEYAKTPPAAETHHTYTPREKKTGEKSNTTKNSKKIS
jgi:hypothetical protein